MNKKLQGLFSLDHNVRLYVPSTVDVNVEATEKQAEYIGKALQLFSQVFGGATSFDAVGAWLSKQGIVTEKVKIIESYASKEQVEASLDQVIALAETIKSDMSQDAVSLEYDNKMYFI